MDGGARVTNDTHCVTNDTDLDCSEGQTRSPGLTPGLARVEERVEQQAEGCERLRAMLDGEAEEHDVAGADARADDGGAPGNRAFAFEPAADQQILAGVAGDRLDPLRRSRRDLERGTEAEETSGLGRHAEGHR